MAQVADPVCGMTFDSTTAPAQMNYQGQAYYFCSEECMKMFRKKPEQYVKPNAQPA
jgi:P-type Cu+ transporter